MLYSQLPIKKEHTRSSSTGLSIRESMCSSLIPAERLEHTVLEGLSMVIDLQLDEIHQRLVAATHHLILVYNLATDASPLVLPCPSRISCIRLVPGSGQLLSGHHCGRIIHWDLDKQKQLGTLEPNHPRAVACMDFQPQSGIAVTATDSQIQLWNLREHRRLHSIKVRNKALLSIVCGLPYIIAQDRASTTVYELTGDGLVEREAPLSDLLLKERIGNGTTLAWQTGDVLSRLMTVTRHWGSRNSYNSLARLTGNSSRDGSLFALPSADYAIQLFQSPACELLAEYEGHFDTVNRICISEDKNTIYSAGNEGVIKRWHRTDKLCQKTLAAPIAACIKAILINEDRHLVVCGTAAHIKIYSMETGVLCQTLIGHRGSVNDIAASDNGERLVSAGLDGTARVWDLATGACIHCFAVDGIPLHTACMSEDGRLIAVGCGDGYVRVYDVNRARLIHQLDCGGSPVRCVQFDNSASRVFCGTKKGWLYIFETGSGSLLACLPAHSYVIHSLALSRDQHLLVSGSFDGRALLWDLFDYRLLHEFHSPHPAIRPVCFDVTGKHIYAGVYDGTLVQWHIDSIRISRTFAEGHRGWVRSLSLSQSGQRLFSCGADGQVCCWDTKTGELLATLYNLSEGFLWTTPKTRADANSWLWTNRPDLITYRRRQHGNKDGPTGFETCDIPESERNQYFSIYNNQLQVMGRINVRGEHMGSSDSYQTLLQRYKRNITHSACNPIPLTQLTEDRKRDK